MSSAEDLRPFRVEWRPNAVTHWTLIHHSGDAGEASTLAEATLIEHKGQVRVVEQRVVLAKGLGLVVSRPPRVLAKVNPVTTVRR